MLAFSFLPERACLAAPGGVNAHVSQALESLASGDTQASVELLQEAILMSGENPLPHAAMGLALLIGNRTSDAAAEFATATKCDDQCALAIYGRGLVALGNGDVGRAVSFLTEARSTDPDRDMRGAIEYVKQVGGGSFDKLRMEEVGISESSDEAVTALHAMALMKQKRFGEAEAIWNELQSKAARPGFGERIGCSMSFLAKSPLTVAGQILKAGYVAPASVADKLKTVKGTIVLQADLSRARTVSMVTFLVDDKLVGITNNSPFQCSWDTTRWTNGRHTVKITGTDKYGATVSEKSTQVVVRNPVKRQGPLLDDDSAGLWDVLWGQMKLKPSAAAVNYNLALCAQETGDLEMVKGALERVMAVDPGYLDAASRLSKLYGPAPAPQEVRKIQTKSRTLALTFDDGPRPDTAALLDVLKQKGVKATFFVVGKQAERYPDLVKRIVDEGHEIGNHTYSHFALEYLTTREIERDVFRNAAVVRSITGREMRMLRAPGAHVGKKVEAVTRKFGMRNVLYSANCSKIEGTTGEKILRYVAANARPGAVILMHNPDAITLRALPEVMDMLREKGFGFATLSDLLTNANHENTKVRKHEKGVSCFRTSGCCPESACRTGMLAAHE